MFGDPTFNDYYRKALDEANRAILYESESAILSADVDEVSNSIFHRFALMPLQYDPQDLSCDIKKEMRRVPAHMREGPYQYSGDTDWEFEVAVISIPILRNPNLEWIKKLSTGTWTSDGFEDRIVYDQNEISFSFETKWYGSRMSEEQVVNEINSNSERLMQVLEAKNSQIKSENDAFMRAIKSGVELRKAQLSEDKEKLGALSQKLKIPMKRRATTADPEFKESLRVATATKKVSRPVPSSTKFDVFICHASEDKESFVETLAQALNDAGFSVWYDDFQLAWGDSLRQSIDRGLVGSKYGIVVLSRPFFEKKWTEHELDGLFAKEAKNKKVILPIWHNVTRDDVLGYSPALADRLAKKSGSDDFLTIVAELKDLLGKD